MDNQLNPTPLQLSSTSLYDLMKLVLLDDKFSAEEKVKLIDELRKNSPNTSDRWTYRWAIWILGSAVLLTIILIYFLADSKYDIPESLIAIGSTVAGGIVGILSPTQRTTSDTR